MAFKEFKKTSPIEASKLQNAIDPVVGELGQQVAKFQENVDVYTKQLTINPLLSGQRLTGFNLVTGQPNLIEHKLGRAPLGWFVTRKYGQADIWENGANVFMERTLDLRSSANVTVDLWVF